MAYKSWIEEMFKDEGRAESIAIAQARGSEALRNAAVSLNMSEQDLSKLTQLWQEEVYRLQKISEE